MATAATSPVEPVNVAPELCVFGGRAQYSLFHDCLIVPLADENKQTNTKKRGYIPEAFRMLFLPWPSRWACFSVLYVQNLLQLQSVSAAD